MLVQSARACGWRGIRKLGAAGGAEGCMCHSFRPAHHCRLELDQSGLLRLLFSALNIGLVLMINLPHDIQFQFLFLTSLLCFAFWPQRRIDNFGDGSCGLKNVTFAARVPFFFPH